MRKVPNYTIKFLSQTATNMINIFFMEKPPIFDILNFKMDHILKLCLISLNDS